MYHHINPNRGDMITVTPADFEGHLRSIVDGGYRTLSLEELLAFIEGSLKIEGRALVLTFDDAYLDNFVYAFPLIKKYAVCAVIFAPTDWLDGASASPLDSAGLRAFRAGPPTHKEAKALVAFSRSGFTALLVSKLRPPVSIIGFTAREEISRRMCLYWGIIPKIMKFPDSTDEMIIESEKALLRGKIVKRGDPIVIIATSPFALGGKSNIMKLHRVGL